MRYLRLAEGLSLRTTASQPQMGCGWGHGKRLVSRADRAERRARDT